MAVPPPDFHPSGSDRIVGKSPAIQAVFGLVDRVADTPATVLITGESGTGKEVIAREIHRRGGYANRPFVAINCTAIPGNLLEAELFGYEKGAFTDARISKRGLLELTEGGTVFLDEIGLMPLELQAKILNVLETKTVRRLGGTRDLNTDIRFIAATNENLQDAVASGRFREDLYYRLNVVPIHLPPLRDREEDALFIARHFLEIYSHRYKKTPCTFAPSAERWLQQYNWPGNVRELRNLVERAVLLSPDSLVQAEDLAVGPVTREPTFRQPDNPPAVEITNLGEIRIALPPWGIALEDVERKLIEEALILAEGNVSRAAQLLHMSRDTLRYRLKKHRLLPPD